MELREPAEERSFRKEVRDWLRANRPGEARPGDDDIAGQMAYDRAWQRTQYDGGWAGISWPREYGGRGLTPIQQLIWSEEYASAGCPLVHDSVWMALNHAGHTLIARGSEEQKTFHLPRILRGEAAWCQGFSEPGAGSDLLSLRTRGEVDGDHLIVNGQKTWTTFAHLADYCELLVRTGEPGGRHKGLTWVIADMHAPGVTVRPIQALDGHLHNCEVFFDDVRIPLGNVVGEVDQGWSVVLTTFEFERGGAAFSSFCQMAMHLEDLIREAREQPGPGGGTPAIADPEIARRLATARARVQSLRALIYVMVEANERGVELGAEGSILHLPYTELEQEIYRLAVDMRGPRGLVREAGMGWAMLHFKSLSATIAGGTSEIQRNTIAERLLGLPR
jgi:alkylation response protein AidB-like acyl-CoA dehydrogenase